VWRVNGTLGDDERIVGQSRPDNATNTTATARRLRCTRRQRPCSTPWRNSSVTSTGFSEASFSRISGQSRGRSALYIVHPRHGRQGIKSTHSSRNAACFVIDGPRSEIEKGRRSGKPKPAGEVLDRERKYTKTKLASFLRTLQHLRFAVQTPRCPPLQRCQEPRAGTHRLTPLRRPRPQLASPCWQALRRIRAIVRSVAG
jgi:hypothetical protein